MAHVLRCFTDLKDGDFQVCELLRTVISPEGTPGIKPWRENMGKYASSLMSRCSSQLYAHYVWLPESVSNGHFDGRIWGKTHATRSCFLRAVAYFHTTPAHHFGIFWHNGVNGGRTFINFSVSKWGSPVAMPCRRPPPVEAAGLSKGKPPQGP